MKLRTRPPWFPICQVCQQPVESIEHHPSQSAVKRYTVHCHGESEERIIGVWAAVEMQQAGRRLPDAFVDG